MYRYSIYCRAKNKVYKLVGHFSYLYEFDLYLNVSCLIDILVSHLREMHGKCVFDVQMGTAAFK